MLEKLLELGDLMLYPKSMNSGVVDKSKYNFGVLDLADKSVSLPIFTQPSEFIVDKNNWNEFSKVGIRPVLPVTEDLQIRLEGCQYIFSSFTIPEIKNCFLSRRMTGNNLFRIYIDNNKNGHDTEILNVSRELRKAYGPQVSIMAGSIISPKVYEEYCKADIDFCILGIKEDSYIKGFYYPLASLILDTINIRNQNKLLTKTSKIIASGSIIEDTDILKALALGADYVMLDKPLMRIVESSGQIFKQEKNPDGSIKRVDVAKGSLAGLSTTDIFSMDLKRNTQGSTIKVTTNMDGWIKSLYSVFNGGFMMTGSLCWSDFRNNVNYCKVMS